MMRKGKAVMEAASMAMTFSSTMDNKMHETDDDKKDNIRRHIWHPRVRIE